MAGISSKLGIDGEGSYTTESVSDKDSASMAESFLSEQFRSDNVKKKQIEFLIFIVINSHASVQKSGYSDFENLIIQINPIRQSTYVKRVFKDS